MVSTNYNLYSDIYKSNLSKGLTALQQQQEFVDVTLAAEGHLVKAHQNILALASPYIKAMLHSAPCQHPVIFLSNVGHKALSFILQYVYSGEVQVPSDAFSSFVEAAKLMHIVGLEHLSVPKDIMILHEMEGAEKESGAKLLESIGQETKEIGPEDFAAQFEINNDSVENVMTQNIDRHTDASPSYYKNAVKIFKNTTEIVNYEDVINQEPNNTEMVDYEDSINQVTNETLILKQNNLEPEIQQHNTNIDITSTQNLDNILTVDSDMQNTVVNFDYNVTHDQEPIQTIKLQGDALKVAYTKSIRGSVQMILNRYLYNMHYGAHGGRKRRWRCLDYRRKHCLAYVDTYDDIPLKRKNEHNHAFHDEKILKAGKKSLFTKLNDKKIKVNKKLEPKHCNENKD